MFLFRRRIFISARSLYLIWLILLLIPSVGMFAQEEKAGQPGAFLRLGVGARALGLGRAFSAISNDASAAYWNPAGLGVLRSKELMGMYSMLSMERQHNYVAMALPTRSFGTFGVSWINLNVGDIEGRDWMGRLTDSFSNSQNAYFVSWGIPIYESIHIGCTAKYITHTLENFQSSGYGIDTGLLIKITEYFSLGAMVRDISSKVSWNTNGKIEEKFPITVRVGTAFIPMDLPITIGLDFEQIANRKATFHGGLEFDLIQGLGLRVGYDNGHISAGGFISIPLGSTHFQSDYSFGEDPIDKTYIHRVSISLKFSELIPEFPNIDKIEPNKLNGYLSLMNPAPDARIVKVMEEYPNYALINVGSQDGMAEGMILEIYRLFKLGGEENQKKSLIGTVKVVKVNEKNAAVRVESINDGFLIREGDMLINK